MTLQTNANPNLQQGASNATRSINILDYWKILRRGIWTIVAVFTIVVGLVALWTFTQVPVYRSVATVEVRTDVRKILPGQDSGGLGVNSFSWSAEERFYNTQIEILKSRDLADRVVKRMGLGADPMFQGTKSPGEILAAMVRAVPRTDTGIIEISLMGTKPQRITDITNVVAEEYKNRNIERARNSQRELIVDMGKQVEELSKSAQDAEKQKYTEGERSNLYVPDNQADVLGSSLRQLMDSNTKTKIEVGELDAVLRSIDAVKAAGGDLLTVKEIGSQPSVVSLVGQRSDLEKDIEGLRVKYLPSHPDLKKRVNELDVVKQKLADEVVRIVTAYRENRNVKAALLNRLDSEIQSTKTQILEAGKRSTEFGIASRDASTKAK